MKPRLGINMVYQSLKEGGKHFYMLIDEYVDWVYRAGATPVLIPTLPDEAAIAEYLDMVDGMLFIGGHDYPPSMYGADPHPETSLARERAGFDLALMREALSRPIPVMGICAGCQLLAIACGGKLIQHIEGHRKGIHDAIIEKEGHFSNILGMKPGESLQVNTYHHQAVDPAAPGNELEITARNTEGGVEVI